MRDCCWQNYPFGGSFHRPPLCESGRFHSFHVFTHQWCLWKLLWYHGWPVRTMPIMWRLLFSFLECFRAMYGGMLHVHWKSHQWWPGGLWHFHLWLLWCFRRLFQWHVVKLWKLSLRNLPLLKHNKFFCEDLLVPRLPAHVLAKQTLLIPNWFEVIRSGLVLQFTSKEEIFNREFDISLLRKKGAVEVWLDCGQQKRMLFQYESLLCGGCPLPLLSDVVTFWCFCCLPLDDLSASFCRYLDGLRSRSSSVCKREIWMAPLKRFPMIHLCNMISLRCLQ